MFSGFIIPSSINNLISSLYDIAHNLLANNLLASSSYKYNSLLMEEGIIKPETLTYNLNV